MISSALHRLLIHTPAFYRWLLRATGRGSLEKRVFLKLIGPGQVVCDAGANHGDFTALFADLVGNKGEVHAFEPGPETFALLTETVGERKNCRLNQAALGEASGVAVLHQPGSDDGQASLREHTQGSWVRSEEVRHHECRVRTLDEYTLGFQRLDFLKCDVEGAELLVLRGAQATLARFSPVLFVEVYAEWSKAFDYSPADLIAFLVAAGYETFYLADAGLRRLEPEELVAGPANLLCAKKGTLPDGLEA